MRAKASGGRSAGDCKAAVMERRSGFIFEDLLEKVLNLTGSV
jgi:hypothetical protein